MFCFNCGCEVPEGVHFCSKCGARIKNGDLAVVKEEEFEKNAPVSENFENITIQNQFSERVNSELFADRKSQNKLFSVYAELIAPVRKIEELTESIKSCNKQIAYLRDEKNAEMWMKRLLAIVFIICAILFWIDGSPIETVSEMIIPGIVEPVLQWATERDSFLLTLSVSLIMGLFTIFAIPFLVTIAFWLLCRILVAPIYKKEKYKKNLAEADRIEKIRDGMLEKRDAICFAEKDKLMYVPKKYRYSEAIAYFVDLYKNTRADTLKEAVNIYEHDKQEQEKLETLTSKMDEVLEVLSVIAEKQ